MKTITLRISNSGAHFSDTGLIPWSATNLPSHDFRFNERKEIYWEVQMLSYNKDTARLQVQVMSFEAKEDSFAPDREMRSPVRVLAFLPLQEEPFKAQLSYYKAGSFNDILQRESRAGNPSLHPAAAPPTPQKEGPSHHRWRRAR